MVRSSADMPVWRLLATALAAFTVGVQIVLSGLSMGFAVSAARADAAVICTHDQADVGGGTQIPIPRSHDSCPACTCPQSAQVFLAAPMTAEIGVLEPRAKVIKAHAGVAVAELHYRAPYASRAPPRFA